MSSRGFDYYHKLILNNNKYNVYEYIREVNSPLEQKAIDMMTLLSMLHNKTTFYKEMDIKPHQFVSLLVQGKLDKLLESKAIWHCLSCMACVERCPRGVAPQGVIEAVRQTVIRAQGANGITAEDIPPEVNELVPQQLLVSAYRKYNK